MTTNSLMKTQTELTPEKVCISDVHVTMESVQKNNVLLRTLCDTFMIEWARIKYLEFNIVLWRAGQFEGRP